MPLIGAEAGAMGLVAFLAAAIISAYLSDWAGLTIAPAAILPLSLAAATAVFVTLRRRATADRSALAAFSLVVSGMFAWLMWRARPDFLPAGTGSDLTHHLALLTFIERHGRLVHDASLGAYLGEMIDYTPGAHLLIALAGAWFRHDALHVTHTVVALTVALKSGVIFLIARRLMPDGVPRVQFALAAVLLLLLPRAFFVGSFMEQSFLSQVVSELFAIAMWWTIVEWETRPSASTMALFALFGAAAFLTWPVWIGPLVLTLAWAALAHRGLAWTVRVRHLAVALVPIAVIAAMYASARQVYGFQMVHAVGYALWPTPRTLTWGFVLLAVPAFIRSIVSRRTLTAAVLFIAIVLQGVALIAMGLNSGAHAPYLSLKMAYLAIYPLAVSAAVLIASAWREVMREPAATPRLAWIVIALAAFGLVIEPARSLANAPAPKPVITQPVFLAGDWARTRVPPACVDYLVADGYTGYWLHLAVFGNPRAAGRTLEDDTFEPKKALIRWILPNGLPYAIADDFDALPRDIRTNVDVLARFGPAAVVKRRGPSTCG